MEERFNAGYKIIESAKVGKIEFVIGYNPDAYFKYVCWACRDGSLYFLGRYFESYDEALSLHKERCENEAEYLKSSPKRRHQWL